MCMPRPWAAQQVHRPFFTSHGGCLAGHAAYLHRRSIRLRRRQAPVLCPEGCLPSRVSHPRIPEPLLQAQGMEVTTPPTPTKATSLGCEVTRHKAAYYASREAMSCPPSQPCSRRVFSAQLSHIPGLQAGCSHPRKLTCGNPVPACDDVGGERPPGR